MSEKIKMIENYDTLRDRRWMALWFIHAALMFAVAGFNDWRSLAGMLLLLANLLRLRKKMFGAYLFPEGGTDGR